MRYVFSLAILCLGATLDLAVGQTRDVPGFYLTHERDTVTGVFTVPTRFSSTEVVDHLINWRIYFRPASTAEAVVLTPPEVAGFSFSFNDQPQSYLSVPNVRQLRNPFGEPDHRIFLRAVVSGQVTLLSRPVYQFFSGEAVARQQGGGRSKGFYEIREHYFLLVNGEVIDLNGPEWRDHLRRFLDGQSDLAVARMKRRDIPAMVVAYVRG